MPIGAILGAILKVQLLKCTKRLIGLYVFTIVNILSVALVNITTFPTLIIGRFVEGVMVGGFAAVAPIYLR